MRKLLLAFLGLMFSVFVVGCDESDIITEISVESVSLNKSSVSLSVDATVTLTVTITPEDADNQKVNWKSSDSSIATVDADGLVTAVAEGEAVITVSSDENPNLSDECAVKVMNIAVSVESVSLNKNSLTLTVGASETLVATVEPEDADIQTVGWVSSDEDVATVDEDGVVTAIAEGEAIITVSSDEDSDLKDECVVTVSSTPVDPGAELTLATISAENLPSSDVWVITDAAAYSGVRSGLNYVEGNDRPVSYDGNGDFYNLYMALEAAEEAGREISLQFPNLTTVPQFALYDVENVISGTEDYPLALVSVEMPLATNFGEEAFAYCSGLRSVSLASATATSRIMFYHCSSLVSVELPKLVTLEDYTFYGCSTLAEVSLPSVSMIGNGAFYEAYGLQKVDAPGVTTLGYMAFQKCTSLESVDFPLLQSLPLYAFTGCSGLKSVEFEKVTTVAGYTFQNCTSLESVSMPKLETLAAYTFSSCTSLQTVNLPLVSYVETGAFAHCNTIKEVSLPNAETLEMMIFWACWELESVSLPKAKFMASNSFYQNYVLTDLLMATESTSLYLDEDTFNSTTDLSKVSLVTGDANGSVIAYTYWTVGSYVFGPFYSAEYYVEPEPATYSLSTVPTSGASIGEDVWTITDASASSSSDFANLREAIASAGRDVTVKFPSLKSFPAEAFYMSGGDALENLVAIEAPQATAVGEYAFYYATDLQSVSLSALTTLSSSAFYGCQSLMSVSLASLKTLGSQAFSGCSSLTTLWMPVVTEIEGSVFFGADDLENLYIATESTSLSVDSQIFEGASMANINLYTGGENGSSVSGNMWTVGSTQYGPFKSANYFSGTEKPTYTLATIPTDGSSIIGDTWVITDASASTSSKFSNLKAAVRSAGRDISLEFTELTSLPSGALYDESSWTGTDNLASISAPKVTSVGGDALAYCDDLTTIYLPAATTLAAYAIWNNTALTSLTVCTSSAAVSIPVNFITQCDMATDVVLMTGSEDVTGVAIANNIWYVTAAGVQFKEIITVE